MYSWGFALAAALASLLCQPSRAFIPEVAHPPDDLVAGGLVTSAGAEGVCDASLATALSLAKPGAVVEASVGLGDSVRLPCATKEHLATLGLWREAIAHKVDVCWLHRPSLRTVRSFRDAKANPASPSIGLHRYQLSNRSYALYVGSAALDDAGTFDCLLRLPSKESFLARTRLHVLRCFNSTRSPCFSGACQELKHRCRPLRANCTCSGSQTWTGRWCDRKKPPGPVPAWVPQFLPLILAGSLALLAIFSSSLLHSKKTKLALALIRGAKARKRKEQRDENPGESQATQANDADAKDAPKP